MVRGFRSLTRSAHLRLPRQSCQHVIASVTESGGPQKRAPMVIDIPLSAQVAPGPRSQPQAPAAGELRFEPLAARRALPGRARLMNSGEFCRHDAFGVGCARPRRRP